MVVCIGILLIHVLSGKNKKMLTVSVKKVIARDHDVVGKVMYCDRTSNQQWRAKILKNLLSC